MPDERIEILVRIVLVLILVLIILRSVRLIRKLRLLMVNLTLRPVLVELLRRLTEHTLLRLVETGLL